MDITSDVLKVIKSIKETQKEEALKKIQKAEEVFLEVKEELISKIDLSAYKDGEVTLRKEVSLPDGKDSIDYNHLVELCRENYIRVDWSEHMGLNSRRFVFVLNLKQIEQLDNEVDGQVMLKLK